MASLSAEDVLRIWEAGPRLDSVERTLLVLAAASPDASPSQLAQLPLGVRDGRLLALREETFGPRLEALATCSSCGERVEFAVSVHDLRAGGEAQARGTVSAAEWSVDFRPPNSEDASAAAACRDPGEARRLLAHRCVLEARRGGTLVDRPDLPAGVIARIAEAMGELDPQAEVLLDYRCPACGRAGQTLLDVAAFLWEEIRSYARRLLAEVHLLAGAYGWREADILAMTPERRGAYVDMVT